MSRTVTIYVVFHEGLFVDVFASYSAANASVPWGQSGWEIKRYVREDY